MMSALCSQTDSFRVLSLSAIECRNAKRCISRVLSKAYIYVNSQTSILEEPPCRILRHSVQVLKLSVNYLAALFYQVIKAQWSNNGRSGPLLFLLKLHIHTFLEVESERRKNVCSNFKDQRLKMSLEKFRLSNILVI